MACTSSAQTVGWEASLYAAATAHADIVMSVSRGALYAQKLRTFLSKSHARRDLLCPLHVCSSLFFPLFGCRLQGGGSFEALQAKETWKCFYCDNSQIAGLQKIAKDWEDAHG